MTARSILLSAGTVSLCISLLPWLGLGGFYFCVPGWTGELPRLHWIQSIELYRLLSVPFEFIGTMIPFGDVVFFPGEGIATVQPFYLFLFYHLLGWFLVWIALRAPLDELIQKLRRQGNATVDTEGKASCEETL